MKKSILKVILVAILLLVGNQMLMAKDRYENVNGICYKLFDEDMTAMVVERAQTTGSEDTPYIKETQVTGDIVLPNTVNFGHKDYTLTSIGEGAFEYCTELTSIVIPSSVTSIGKCAFEGLSNLTSVNIPYGVTSIEDYVFSNCRSLTSIEIPSSVTSIGPEAFYGCRSLTSVELPSSVTTIEEYAFSECGITAIEFPPSLTSIGKGAFAWCPLTSVFIPSSVTFIGESPFISGYNLKCITVEEDNKVYDSRNNCNAIIETEANKVVSGCNTSTIPYGVTTIGISAFQACVDLTSIEIPSSVTSIEDYAFCWTSGLKSIIIPSSVIHMGEGAFSGCDGLTSITIPSSISRIENSTFNGCENLASITILSNAECIGTDAFGYCPKLKDVYLYGQEMIKDYNKDSFWHISDNATLHVVASLVDAYKSAEYWSDWFSNIVALEGEAGINGINANATTAYSVYSVGGKKLPSMRNGINILRLKNGKSIKVAK